jgi:hypothetical protein
MQGRAGDLWIDTVVAGLVRYHDGSFRAYGKQQGIPADINGLTDDDSGNLWLLSAGRILRWDETSGRFLDIAPGSPNRLYRNFRWESRGFWTRDNDRLHCFIKGLFRNYKYAFHVIAGNSDGVWNTEGKILNVTVLAPFYETWRFETLALLCIGTLVAAAWRFRVSQLQQEQAAQQAFRDN